MSSEPAWQDRARCLDGAGQLFVGEDTRHAKAFCALCPVWQPCLNTGLDEPAGIWGGLSHRERRRLRRLRTRIVIAPADPQNAADVRSLVVAGLAPERVSVAAGIEMKTITACLEANRPRRRRDQASRTVDATGSP